MYLGKTTHHNILDKLADQRLRALQSSVKVMTDHFERVLQLDAKFLRTLDLLDPNIYGFDDATKNYLRSVNYKLKPGQLRRTGKQGVCRQPERNVADVISCGPVKTISRIWRILAESDPAQIANAAMKNANVPDELSLGYNGGEDAEAPSFPKAKVKAKSKGNAKQKPKKKKEKKLTAKKRLVPMGGSKRESALPLPNDEGNATTNASTDKLSYSKFEFAGNDDSKRKHRKRGTFSVDSLVGRRYGSLLRKVEQRQEKLESLEEKDPAKAELVKRKIRWDAAERRAQGIKIKDNPSLLRKGLKRRLKKKERSKKKWAQRVAAVEHSMQKRQEIRRSNIRKRIEQKKKFRAKEHF
uniref:SURF6 domain-containing protein n=1 Tax=Trichuris muris TaxID=70415 RepID=A0A5S6R338_TRIMR